jgi:hypothetical protein
MLSELSPQHKAQEGLGGIGSSLSRAVVADLLNDTRKVSSIIEQLCEREHEQENDLLPNPSRSV